jgi:soluble lytic murein transglycosylase-like protein
MMPPQSGPARPRWKRVKFVIWRCANFGKAGRRALSMGLTLAAFAIAAPAVAHVFEVGPGGVMTIKSAGPAVASNPGSTPSEPLPARPTPAKYARAINYAAKRFDLSPALVDAVARQESGYRPAAVSPKGAVGIMQLTPQTARRLGVDARDPWSNIMGGAAYLRSLLDRFGGRIDLALAAYNAGPGAVVRYGGVPPYRETRSYVQANLDRLSASVSTLAH